MTRGRANYGNKARTAAQHREALTVELIFTRRLGELTVDELAARHKKLPRHEIAEALYSAQLRGHG